MDHRRLRSIGRVAVVAVAAVALTGLPGTSWVPGDAAADHLVASTEIIDAIAVPEGTGAEFSGAPVRASVVRDPALRPLRLGQGQGVHAAVPLTMDGEALAFSVQAVPLQPGQTVVFSSPAGPVTVRHQAGEGTVSENGDVRWTAPKSPGMYALRVDGSGGSVAVTALVLHPATSVRNGSLNGYRIGRYVSKPLRGDPAYLPPEGFVEVRASDGDVLVSPRLTLGQFLCKQPGDPRYVAVSLPLVAKLEAIADNLEDRGIDPSALTVMSGFRTPAYNLAIGNKTVYSRHLWGDAADIYIDADGDGDMDDLNRDGRVDIGDARALARWIEDVVHAHGHLKPGGMSVYRRNAAHGPFVHVDARGTRARW